LGALIRGIIRTKGFREQGKKQADGLMAEVRLGAGTTIPTTVNGFLQAQLEQAIAEIDICEDAGVEEKLTTYFDWAQEEARTRLCSHAWAKASWDLDLSDEFMTKATNNAIKEIVQTNRTNLLRDNTFMAALEEMV
jgi:hypothetical protein